MRKIKPIFGKIMDGFGSLLFPNTCPFCGKVSQEEICSLCRAKLPYVTEPCCMRCGKPIRQEEAEYCDDCQKVSHSYDKGHALLVHVGSVRRAIYQFKYHNRRIYSRVFAKELVRVWKPAVLRWQIHVIIPIPLSKKRKRKRGYNQAELLAVEIGKLLHIPVDGKSLVRVRDTAPQKKMDLAGRRKNMRHAFAWKGQKRLCGNVLVVDDIYTTGNTIDEAARVLKEAGADRVFFLTISIGQDR